MKRIGSVQASVVAFVLLLAYHGKVECGSMGISGQTNATIPAQIHRKMRATYREPELPIFGTTEEDESRMSGHNSRNQSRDDEDGYRHQRPVTKSIKKSSSSSSKKSSSKKSGGSSASIKSSSSKKSSKRGGESSNDGCKVYNEVHIFKYFLCIQVHCSLLPIHPAFRV